MTLTTHALVGASFVAISSALTTTGVSGVVEISPVANAAITTAGLILAFSSHYVLDAIPHWDYDILSASFNPEVKSKFRLSRQVFLDILRIGCDGLLGLVTTLFIFYNILNFSSSLTILVLVGAMLGMLPDFLQFIHSKIDNIFINFSQKIHNHFHTCQRGKISTLAGILHQAMIVCTFLLITVYCL